MNTDIIETSGISFLNIFLGKTRLIKPAVKQMDKYPIWDGEILMYSDTSFSADKLYCRVPVQVKSEFSDKLDREKVHYQIKKSDLEKYAEDGGVLFIKVIFNDSDKYSIYMQLLLKGDIIDLLKNSKKDSYTKGIVLDKVNYPKEVITICKNYKIHSKLQAQIPLDYDKIKYDNKTEFVFYSYINNVKDLVDKEQYAYAKLGHDVLGYAGKVKNESLFRVIKITIGTSNKKYYDEIIETITEKEHYFMIGKYVKLENNRLIINNNLIDDNIVNAINDLEFVYDLLENKNITIGKEKTSFEFVNDNQFDEKIKVSKDRVIYFKSALDIIRKVGLSVKVANITKVMSDEKLICDIRNIVVNKVNVEIDEERDSFVNIIDVLNQKYLIYFARQNGKKTYKGYNYIDDDIILKFLVVEDDQAQLSRLYNLKAELLCNINMDFEKIKKEIKLVTKNDITVSFISVLLLEFIKCYDLTGDNTYIEIAEFINKLIRKCDGYGEDYYLINKYQMIKRRKKLSSEDIKSITSIKINNINDLKVVCACCLLTDSIEEFQLYFDKMGEDDQSIFKTWAIYKFYEDTIKIA